MMLYKKFVYAINKIRKLVRLAQWVEQWTDNPEVGGSSPPSNYLIFECLGIRSDFLYEARYTQNFK